MDYRAEAFRKKFSDAGRHLGVRPNQIVSLKLRENVNSYAEYREFLHALERETGLEWSEVDGELQGKGYLLSDKSSRVIFVEHESGLEILYIAGSIASLIGLVPLIVQGWRAFRFRHLGRHDFDHRGIEIRQLDEKGHLSEDHIHDSMVFTPGPFSANAALASAAKTIECDLRRLMNQMQSLTRRVEVLEKQMAGKTKKRKPITGRKKVA
jgi:hypothetical protein